MNKIVLVGFQGSGKNTVGEYLISKYGYMGISFADALKDAVSSIFCWDRSLLEGNTNESRLWRETVDEWWAQKLNIPDLTPRWAMRNFGTDIMREHFCDEIWIRNVERRIMNLGDVPIVVTDGRFPNEIDLVKEIGGKTIRVKRGPEPDYWNTALAANSGDASALYELKMHQIHPSEYAWIGQDFDAIIENDSDTVSLFKKIDRFFQ